MLYLKISMKTACTEPIKLYMYRLMYNRTQQALMYKRDITQKVFIHTHIILRHHIHTFIFFAVCVYIECLLTCGGRKKSYKSITEIRFGG